MWKEYSLKGFKNRVLREICGLGREVINWCWSTLYVEEINDFYFQ
jgi:hypothetical protein